ncbi:MAG: preprotein translocase subunit SecG [Candidatus Hydrogenedentes bacterium]|nr:preprotein translocase subunit SecG [Candidatus Hydrogenedentota bacterium]
MLDAIFSWNTLWIIMWILYLPACIGLIVIVLLQKGKSSGFAGAFGVGGGSETVFGPRARKSLPVKMTYGMAALFMILSMSMSLVAGRVHRGVAPEAVEVEETATADQVYNELLSDVPQAESTGAAESTLGPGDEAPAAEPAQATEAPVEPSEEAAAPEAEATPEPESEPAEAAAPAAEEPSGEAPAEEAPNAS